MEPQQRADSRGDGQLAEWYRSGLTIKQVAAKTGISPEGVSRSLARSGISTLRPPWDAERDRRAAELYRSGLTQAEVAGKMKASPSRVGQSLRRSGISSLHRPRWDAARDRRAAELYRSGLTQAEVAGKMGSTQSKVGASLKRSGVATRGLAWDAERDRKVAELYLAGTSEDGVAKSVGSSRQRVAQSLRRSGVPARSRGSAGPRNGSWKGGRNRDRDGYVLVHAPWHPRARKNKYVLEHRLVMERVLGRFLEPGEVVHHSNGEKSDNRPENLRLFASNAEHLAVELLGRRPMWTEDGLRRLAEAWRDPDRHQHGPHAPRGTGARKLRRDAIREMKSDPDPKWDHGPVVELPPFPLGQRGSDPGRMAESTPAKPAGPTSKRRRPGT